MSDFTIRNWLEYQHYGDKKEVPWIKLHYKILTSQDFSSLDDRSKLLMIVCMLIASNNGGKVPNNPKHIQRLGNLDILPDFNPLIECGFLEGIELVKTSLDNSRKNQILSSESLSISSSLSSSDSKKNNVRKNYSDEFDEINKIYPPNNGSKFKAHDAYQKALKETDHETISRSVTEFAKSARDSGTQKQFIPHFATWLNGKRWETDYSVTIESGTDELIFRAFEDDFRQS